MWDCGDDYDGAQYNTFDASAAELASGVEYADVRLYTETCPCGATVPISDHSHDDHWASA